MAAVAACICALAAVLVVDSSGPSAKAAFADQCGAPDRTLTPTSETIGVAVGETVLLTGGAFTGGIDSLPSGGTLCVATGASLAPPYMNNASGALVIAGDADLTLPFVSVGTGFELSLEGTAVIAGLNINGSSAITVARSGELTISNSFSPGTGSIVNAGTMHVASSMNLNTAVSLTNSATLTVDQSSTIDGRFVNTGVTRIGGTLTINGSGLLQNECAVSLTGDLNNNGAASTNQGLVLVSGRFSNNGTWRQSPVGTLDSATLTDDGHVTGFGQYHFSGATSMQGSFVGDSSTAPIVVDSTAPPGQVFHVQTGTIANVVRGTVGQPDLLSYPAPDCATPRPSADLIVAKTGPATATQNSTLTYSISVTNAGPSAADAVVVTDALPAGLTGVTASAGGVVGPAAVTWVLGTVAPASTVTLTVAGTVTSAPGAILTDVGRATSTTPDPNAGNNDGSSDSSRASTLVVGAVIPNTPPLAGDLTVQGTTGAELQAVVTATNAEPGQELSFAIVTGPSHGTLGMLPGGEFVYRSADDFTGVDSATFQACDNGTPALCDQGVITINVFPVATDGIATVFQDQSVVMPLVADNATPGSVLAGQLVTQPANGTATLDTAAGTATYTPNAGFLGTDSFVFQVCSPTAPTICDSATVAITVIPLNQPPVIDHLTMRTTAQVPVEQQLAISDPDGDAVIASRGTPPRSGTATVDATGLTRYSPLGGFAGRDFYTAIVCDVGTPRLCSTGGVTVEVLPVADDDSASTPVGVAVTVEVTANDLGSVDAPSIVTAPRHGTATTAGRAFVYTPDAAFVGTDTFVYSICAVNAADLCATATASVTTVAPVAPVGPPGPVAPAAPSPTEPVNADGSLSSTGSDAGGWVWLGLLAVAAGAAVLITQATVRAMRARRKGGATGSGPAR